MNQRIFITGGASGLGQALARQYAARGWRVCIGDVNQEAGEAFAQTLSEDIARAAFVPCDVTRESDLQAAADWLEKNWGGVDIVVNNAGVAAAGGIAEVPLSDWQWILEINLLGVVRGCKVFTPLFRKQGHGRFVNIASMAGLLNPPSSVSYNVSKAGVISLSETLSFELADDNIAVTVVCPSFFKTNLASSLRSTSDHLTRLTQGLINKSKFDADQIAGAICRGIDRGDFLVIPQDKARTAWRVKRFAPFKLFSKIVAKEKKRFLAPRPAGNKTS
ncbi:SDR family oxidoreductase [Desulfosudis oleivorans]|uniref:Short-chain dehydrogenase/reductase SDR n=1 Tax=Desulfosudis oleivorans (strain DSM 6200 / JCM 39069 / Hxd3) TaxID=96561 RepID=A8ZSI4_DESOH|nr:SDR family oxidoreductase [Desulfosudis oleivorans]ABW67721.1 short-chain dehydrogenase/reductase SDR [Desulfosudis oleivorans Hxd3]